MKKRKAPVLLLSMLFVLVGAMVIFGMKQGGPATPNQPDPNQAADAPSQNEVEQSMKPNVAPVPKGKVIPHVQDSGPSIALPPQTDVQYSKPKPTADGTTSSQWYHDKH